jgi:hypothetical protein
MKVPQWRGDLEARSFLREAEALLGGSSHPDAKEK